MGSGRQLPCVSILFAAALLVWPLAAQADISFKDYTPSRPLVLDQNTDYTLTNVNITSVHDAAALTLTGKINSVTINKSSFGNVRAGDTGKAAALDCAGATVGALVANDTSFFDAENQLASLREGSFGLVTFRNCSFKTSPNFLKEMYSAAPWRTWPPVTEFYNIDRLELFDNTFANTIVVIHPSVKKVVIRGEVPGLQIDDKNATQVIRLPAITDPDQTNGAVALVTAMWHAICQ